MYEKYKTDGFELIAFPANQFGCQAPYSSQVEREYAYSKFGMTFPIYDKIGVKNRINPTVRAMHSSPRTNIYH